MSEVEIKKTTDDDMGLVSSGPYYPYGTSLEFDGDLLDQLEIFDKVEVGGEVKISGTLTITRKSETKHSDDEGEVEERRCMSFQLTKVSLQTSDEKKPMGRSETLYKE